MTDIDFDSDGDWDFDECLGPAIHTPKNIKNIMVNEYRIEWLDMSEPNIKFYPKNHMVGTLIFETPMWIGNTEYKSARISMEVDVEVPQNAVVPGILDVRSAYTASYMHSYNLNSFSPVRA